MPCESQPSTRRQVPWFLVMIGTAALVLPSDAVPEDPGSTPRIQDIRVTGNERTQTWIILREMETRVGMPYDHELVLMDRDRIDNLGLFSEVVVDSVRLEQSVVVEVRVKERLVWIPLEWIPYPVVNWNDENGWSYGLGLTNPNASGKNRSFSILAESGGRRLAYFNYSDPWIAGNHGSAALSLYFSESTNREGYTDRWGSFRLGLGTYLGEWGRARLNLDVGEIETDAWRTASGNRHDRTRSVALGLAYDTRDVYADPRSGAYVGGSVGFTRPVLDGTVDYTSYRADVRWFWTPWTHQALAAGVSLLWRGEAVPDYRKLRLGGTAGVRGIDPLSFKGDSRVLASVEYRVAIKEKKSYDFWFVRNVDLGLMLAVFVDAGGVWSDAETLDKSDVFGSVGAGLRVLGRQVLRAEVAYSRRDGTRWIAATGMPF